MLSWCLRTLFSPVATPASKAVQVFLLPFVIITFSSPKVFSQSLAGNIVVNGGFESGFGGWQGTYGWLNASGFALEGTRVGVVDDVGSSSVGQPMWQTLNTIPGVQYEFRFSLLSGYGRAGEQSQGNLGSPVNVYWGGDLFGAGGQYLGVFRNTSTTTWSNLTFLVTATSSSTIIQFIDYNDKRWQLIDGVSVVPTPEPVAAPLLLGGPMMISRRLRRR